MTTETSDARGEWVLVPRVPTPEMVNKAADATEPDFSATYGEIVEMWSAMLAAAPQPPSEAQAQGGGEVVAYSEKFRASGDWSRYPIGTRAYDIQGGYWERVANGWKWCTGSTFPTPGGDAIYVAVPVRVPAPPSAPVGAVELLSLLRADHWREVYVGRLCMRLEVTYEHAAWERLMEQVEAALAQQPAAVDGAVLP